MHKNATDPPLRSIISQVLSPTYSILKELNTLITPYLPQKYSIKSTDELLLLLRTTQPKGMLASLDIENLFTNVPVNTTIDIILECVFENPDKRPPNIPRKSLQTLLKLCTTEAPFRHINGSLYYQKDGVAMGSPLGPTFANFYMAKLENQILSKIDTPPHIYCRYVDDILVMIDSEEQLIKLR